MKLARRLAMLIALSTLASGCATIVHGTDDQILVNTDPAGARVQVNGGSTYQTPAAITLSKGTDYYLKIEKDGYEEENVRVARVFDNWGTAIFGNILWFVPGLLVDALSGGAFDFEPRVVNITLRKRTPGTPDSP